VGDILNINLPSSCMWALAEAILAAWKGNHSPSPAICS